MAGQALKTGETTRRNEPPAEHRFKPGVSGNPGGRPRGLAKAVRDVPLESGDEPGELLLARIAWAIVSDGKEKTENRLAAWRLLAERGWGKPAEFVPIEDADPLELSDQEASEVAIDFGRRVDELAARRAVKAK